MLIAITGLEAPPGAPHREKGPAGRSVTGRSLTPFLPSRFGPFLVGFFAGVLPHRPGTLTLLQLRTKDGERRGQATPTTGSAHGVLITPNNINKDKNKAIPLFLEISIASI